MDIFIETIYFILAIIFTEAITELVVKSEIFSPIREYFFNKRKNRFFKFIHDLLDCGYCFSVWAAALSYFLLFVFNNNITIFFVVSVVLHRLSNVTHFIIDRIGSKFD